MSEVILVDTANQPVGTAEKMIAHRGSGQLHRAFSVFLFNGLGDMLLQQRAAMGDGPGASPRTDPDSIRAVLELCQGFSCPKPPGAP